MARIGIANLVGFTTGANTLAALPVGYYLIYPTAYKGEVYSGYRDMAIIQKTATVFNTWTVRLLEDGTYDFYNADTDLSESGALSVLKDYPLNSRFYEITDTDATAMIALWSA